ncbi:transcription-repair coupling factor [Xylanimonas cellulosilytica DSM 15894]|uniref:Transcription-repair-coupling factor n=1 Tax=Xylanimonas cellulosilytica (strain DSM 15894 / JCM 12276 / CECT 5975 / KCTC 9989 / LMG 20990 / NBRC 107835 / XIL07) TaxID=446471 RepID=D1BXQ8_XYLCX|nr:transcription-repair coupling factor [Xylanimonas cellulosilytica]ACZ31699.1 transcription-repair coupling factor [Xylanimonas cellulosilytica DSM 15894]
MNLTGLVPALLADPGAAAALEDVRTRGFVDVVGPQGVRAPLLVEAAKQRPVVVVTATGRQADELAASVRAYLPDEQADEVAVLPAWETLPHERLSPRADTVARRIAVFRRLAHPVPETGPAGPIRVLVMPARALLQPVVSGLGELEPVALHDGDVADLTDVAERLVAAAYSRVDMVERRGEFAVRGGILDVFPPTEDHPLRVEFWGDEVSEIRWFSVADQRSLEIAQQGLWAPPCREILLTASVRARAAALVETMPGAVEMLDRLAAGVAVEGMESLAPVLVDELVPVLDLVPDDALLVIDEPERVRRRAHDLVATTEEFLAAAWTGAVAGGAAPIDLSSASFASFADTRAVAARRGLGWWTLSAFGLDPDAADAVVEPVETTPQRAGQVVSTGSTTEGVTTDGVTTHTIKAREVESYRGDLERALEEVRRLQRDQWRLVLTTEGHGPAKRMVEQLMAADCPARLVSVLDEQPDPGVVLVLPALVGKGFVAPDLQLAVFSESDLTGRQGTGTRDMRKLPSRRRNVVDPLQLRAGDYVVHEQHGVGRFVEMVQRTLGAGSNAATREYLVLEYASSKRGQPGDRLFVPMDQLDQVTKYVGGEAPSLSKMGGADWKNTKAKARKHVKEIAGELIRLYSARMATQGHAFGADTPWQRELEDAFAYIETPDQLSTIDEVKADMEKPTPMDRLVCGDVGYGKTEIAIRAAFKAIQDGKQVAVLVPTTLLVQQHFETFSERYQGFPVKVAALSRFQNPRESEETIKGLKDGTVDVVIGTHRLITGAVQFKDLGLVIIDEEQRFGVEHKETLKQLRTNVDVLAMSATPIPRTLEMAVTGIREMSTLATPPEERHPVLTYVGAYEERQISAAVRRELLREGQVFYVHNRVESIQRTASRLAELVPEARIGVAHGKMGEHQLDQVIRGFWEKELDVLVCTTIVETGLDISNANTLILERADMLGLSQLHQLRGRVGRGRERAYAYFLYPPEKPLTEQAHDRLATMAAHTDLGAGMQIAMKDLEIRGAGNLLGGEQSGHIQGVGFDLYVRMVGEAVQNFRGDAPEEQPEVTIELPVDAHLPESYIATERLRLEAYKKIAAATDAAALAEVRAELVDRYGPLPDVASALFDVADFRNHARAAGLSDVTAQGKYVRFAPVDLAESAQLRLKRLYPGVILKPAIRAFLVPFPTTARIGGRPLRGAEVLTWARQLVDAVIRGEVSAAAAVGTR